MPRLRWLGWLLALAACHHGDDYGVYNPVPIDAAPSCGLVTCDSLHATCGPYGDGCGNTFDCGTCTSPEVCGGDDAILHLRSRGSRACRAPVPPPARPAAQIADGCGRLTEGCGTCTGAGETCGGGGIAEHVRQAAVHRPVPATGRVHQHAPSTLRITGTS